MNVIKNAEIVPLPPKSPEARMYVFGTRVLRSLIASDGCRYENLQQMIRDCWLGCQVKVELRMSYAWL